jgi:hypothetical protein
MIELNYHGFLAVLKQSELPFQVYPKQVIDPGAALYPRVQLKVQDQFHHYSELEKGLLARNDQIEMVHPLL